MALSVFVAEFMLPAIIFDHDAFTHLLFAYLLGNC